MRVQLITVRGCRLVTKKANKNFKMLCKQYNDMVKIIDFFKEMLRIKKYKKGSMDKFSEAIALIKRLYMYTDGMLNDLDITINKLVKQLRQAEEVKKKYITGPLFATRMDHMASVVIYLREMKKEVDIIKQDISFILTSIEEIEEVKII